MDVTTATPVEIDTKLNDLYNDLARAVNRQATALIQIHQAVGDDTSYRKTKHDLTHEQAIAKAELQAASDNDWLGSARKGLEALIEAQAGMKQITDQIDPLEAEYSRRPWSRAWLVTSSVGHVHRNKSCSTCNIRTSYALMFMFSGQTEAQIVDAAGERACTVCYPTAPAEILNRPTQMFTPDEVEKQAARAARAAAKAARDAKKIANALTADGSELKVTDAHGSRQFFQTERAATTWMVQDKGYHQWLDYSISTEANETIIAAIATKHGKTVEEVTAEIDTKVAKWVKRNRGW